MKVKIYRIIDFLIKNEYIIIISLILINISLLLPFVASTYPYGDVGKHNSVLYSIDKSGSLPIYYENIKGHFGFPSFGNQLVEYPPIFYVIGFLLKPIFGIKVLGILEMVTSSMGILFIYLLTRELTNKKVGILSSSLLLVMNGYKLGGWDQDIFMAIYSLLPLWAVVKYFKTKDFKYLFLISIFLVTLIGVKQTGIFTSFSIFIFFFISILSNIDKRKNIYKMLLLLFSVIVLLIPILGFQISNTGTISTKTLRGWPIIDSVFLSPKFVNYSEWEIELNKEIDLKHKSIRARKYYDERHGKFDQLIKKNPLNLILKYINADEMLKAFPLGLLENTYKIVSQSIYILTFVIGIFIIFKNKLNNAKKMILAILIGGLPIIYYTNKVGYFGLLPLVGIIITAIGINSIINKLNNKTKIAVIIFLFMLYIIPTILSIFSILKFVNVRTREIQDISNYLEKEANGSDIVLLQETNIWSTYIFDNEVFWDYRILFIEKEFENYIKNKYGVNWVIIRKGTIVKESKWSSWVQIPLNSSLNISLNTGDIFKKTLETENYILYKVR